MKSFLILTLVSALLILKEPGSLKAHSIITHHEEWNEEEVIFQDVDGTIRNQKTKTHIDEIIKVQDDGDYEDVFNPESPWSPSTLSSNENAETTKIIRTKTKTNGISSTTEALPVAQEDNIFNFPSSTTLRSTSVKAYEIPQTEKPTPAAKSQTVENIIATEGNPTEAATVVVTNPTSILTTTTVAPSNTETITLPSTKPLENKKYEPLTKATTPTDAPPSTATSTKATIPTDTPSTAPSTNAKTSTTTEATTQSSTSSSTLTLTTKPELATISSSPSNILTTPATSTETIPASLSTTSGTSAAAVVSISGGNSTSHSSNGDKENHIDKDNHSDKDGKKNNPKNKATVKRTHSRSKSTTKKATK